MATLRQGLPDDTAVALARPSQGHAAPPRECWVPPGTALGAVPARVKCEARRWVGGRASPGLEDMRGQVVRVHELGNALRVERRGWVGAQV